MTAMTTGERMKAGRYADQGWSAEEIASRFNRARRNGYLKNEPLGNISAESVSEWLKFYSKERISA